MMGPQDERRLRRRIIRIYTVTSALYFLLGAGLVWQSYAQTRVSPTVFYERPIRVPTGNDDNAVNAYYDYLMLRNLRSLGETWVHPNPLVLGWVYLWLAFLLGIFYFLMFAWYARRTRGDLYPVEVYNVISERGGPVDPFNWALYAVLLSYMLYYSVQDILFGQFY